MSGQRFASLDGLRGVCALTVLLFHADDLFHRGPIFQHGYLAVDMFFLLSGFVIALAHEDRLRAGAGLT
ncbi:MAG TPA: acyltransferase family protein, partial [Rhizomicrobium sp.]|nr:acyltransferase family protein [Rhizomicrobium sp.]